MKNILKTTTFAAMALGLTLGSIAKAPVNKDIVDTAVAAGQFKTLASLLGKAGLVETLKGDGPFTVFAPTDAAFAKLPKDLVAKVTSDKALLTKVLTYHVVSGKVLAKDAVKLHKANSVQGEAIKLAVKGGKLKLNGGSTVTATDILASNGVIHVIDNVILPPSIAAAAKPKAKKMAVTTSCTSCTDK